MDRSLEDFFAYFRSQIIGHQQTFTSPFGQQTVCYADWTASGRAYGPIESCLQQQVMPFLANTHTETTLTGSLMTQAYEQAKAIIKQHVHADAEDSLLFCGSGMTSAVNKLQRIVGLRVPERIMDYLREDSLPTSQAASTNQPTLQQRLASCLSLDETLRPVVFMTHMEHHSHQISWLETIATVEIIPPDETGNVDLNHLTQLLNGYQHRKTKIAAITACSNVTGIQTPYHTIASLMHRHGGVCFVDFACSAPYVDINMHPVEPETYLDAIYFSPHKFLGGPGSAGVLIFNSKLYQNAIPDQPGGGTVIYSNPWQEHQYVASIEQREDGGTPPILQGIKAAMCIRLKEDMGVKNMQKRKDELVQLVFNRLTTIPQVRILEGHCTNRLGVVSFLVEGLHYNLVVKLLNDRFGIQTRGGCSCAGTYGHFLLQVDPAQSKKLLTSIQVGDLHDKPGWVRLSIHPTMTNDEVTYILDAIEWTATHTTEWLAEYRYDRDCNQYKFRETVDEIKLKVQGWFTVAHWDKLDSAV